MRDYAYHKKFMSCMIVEVKQFSKYQNYHRRWHKEMKLNFAEKHNSYMSGLVKFNPILVSALELHLNSNQKILYLGCPL